MKRAEYDGTPEADRAPIKFYSQGNTFYFQYANCTNIPGAELPLSMINVDACDNVMFKTVKGNIGVTLDEWDDIELDGLKKVIR